MFCAIISKFTRKQLPVLGWGLCVKGGLQKKDCNRNGR